MLEFINDFSSETTVVPFDIAFLCPTEMSGNLSMWRIFMTTFLH